MATPQFAVIPESVSMMDIVEKTGMSEYFVRKACDQLESDGVRIPRVGRNRLVPLRLVPAILSLLPQNAATEFVA